MKSIFAAITVALLMTACATTPAPSVYGKVVSNEQFAADQAACNAVSEKALKRWNIFDTSEREVRNDERTKAAQRKCLESRGYVAQN